MVPRGVCGIAGVLRFDGRPVAAAPDIDRLLHRGPDGAARHESRDGACVLALRRLAIVRPDLPARVARDGPITAVSIGEIYDHRRHPHQADGIDTDLVPSLFLRDGPAFICALRGPLACAIYDERTRTLTLTRDAVGKRPMYVRITRDALWFASEQKALGLNVLQGDDVALDPSYVADVLAWGRSRRPSLRGVEELLPGMCMQVDTSGRVTRTQVDLLRDHGTSTSTATETAALFDEAVELRRAPDVSAAVAVGGMDSQLIAARAQLPCFTLDALSSETAHARDVVARLGVAHTVVDQVTPSFTSLRRALFHLEAVDHAACWQMAPALLALTERVRAAGHRVLMIGEGADEIFLGYPWRPRADDRNMRVPDVVMSQGRAVMVPAEWQARMKRLRMRAVHGIAVHPTMITRADDVRALAGRSVDDESVRSDDDLLGLPLHRRAQLEELRADMHMLPVLHADRLAFANGVETRAPFLDRRLIEHALGLAGDVLLSSSEEKPVVRALYRERFGAEAPRKRGFSGVERPSDAVVGERAQLWLERGPRTVNANALRRIAVGAASPERVSLLWRVVLLEELLDVMRGEPPG